jgi:RNA polymerase sigma factor (sigma-70 family)
MTGDPLEIDPAGPASSPRPADAAVQTALVEGRRHILGFLQRRLGNTEEAEEVLQAFMLRALERSSDLRDVATVRGWLSRILATMVVDHQRRASRRRRREQVMSPDDMEALPVEADGELDEAACHCLYQLLPTLKPAYAEIIRRVDLQEEPREQVAAALGLSLNNLAVRLHRGRQAMKKRLVEMCLTCPVHGFLDCRCEEAERARRRREESAAASKL